MALVVEYIGPIKKEAIPSTVLNEVLAKWKDTLLARRELIYNRLMAKIPDETAFIQRIADPSATRWAQFVNPEWPNAELIKLKQRVKISIAYPRWKPAVDAAFAEGGRFEQGVQEKAERFQQVIYTLANVGLRYQGWGPGYKAVGAITGDYRITKYIGPEEVLQGSPVSVFPQDRVNFLRPTLIAKLTQGAVLALYAHEAGLAELRDMVINTINGELDAIISANKLPEYAVAYVHLEYDEGTGTLRVHARAETAEGG